MTSGAGKPEAYWVSPLKEAKNREPSKATTSLTQEEGIGQTFVSSRQSRGLPQGIRLTLNRKIRSYKT